MNWRWGVFGACFPPDWVGSPAAVRFLFRMFSYFGHSTKDLGWVALHRLQYQAGGARLAVTEFLDSRSSSWSGVVSTWGIGLTR